MFENLIKAYEEDTYEEDLLYKKGAIPVIITAPHTIKQVRENGDIKLEEPFTKAIARYVGEEVDCFYLIKNKDTGIDANSIEEEEFKNKLLEIIKSENIKLVIDLHGASYKREFDIEFGTLNNLSADYSTIQELKEAFLEVGINKIEFNHPFKGGGITRSVYFNTEADAVQIEINREYRDDLNTYKIKQICDALIAFIKQYSNFN